MKRFYFLLVIVFTTVTLSAQYTFEKKYGDPTKQETATACVQTSDGGFMLLLHEYDNFLFLRTDDHGGEMYTKTYDPVEPGYGTCLDLCSDGGFIAAGYIGDYESRMVYLIRTDANADTLWTKQIGTSVREEPYAIHQTADGGYAIAGYIEHTDVNTDGFLMKTDANGNLQWTEYYGGSSYDYFYDMEIANDGGYIMVGSTASYDTGYDAYIVKANSSGTEQWYRNYDSGDEYTAAYLFGVDITADGGYIAGGSNSGNYLVRMTAAGDTLWTKIHESWEFHGYDVCVAADGGFAMTSTYTVYMPYESVHTILFKYNSSGVYQWEREFGDEDRVSGGRVHVASDNGFYFSGMFEDVTTEDWQAYLVKTDASGNGCLDYITQLQEICMVTVDESGYNKIIWEPTGEPANGYKIYKETTEGFEHIGTTMATELSEYIDTTSVPASYSNKYKVSIIDTCDVESNTGDFHKTIHLNVSPAVPSGFALTWEHYEGYSFTKYRIFRGTSEDNLVQIDSTISSNFTYTDPTSLTGALYYQVAAVKPDDCTSSSSTKDVGGPYSQSVSNLEDNGYDENVQEIGSDKYGVNIFPNPTEGNVYMSYELVSKSDINIKIYNILGEELTQMELSDQIPGAYRQFLNTEGLQPGVYFIKININGDIIEKELVIKN